MLNIKIRNLIMSFYIFVQSVVTPVSYAVAGAVIDEQGRILLVRHSYKVGLQLPLGGVGRGEAAAVAIQRELKEEVGLTGGTATLFGIYTRRSGWATNVLALYKVTGGTLDFHPNVEVRDFVFVDPLAPPSECTDDSLRRLKELAGMAEQSLYW